MWPNPNTDKQAPIAKKKNKKNNRGGLLHGANKNPNGELLLLVI
jgi:hypothetical protein